MSTKKTEEHRAPRLFAMLFFSESPLLMTKDFPETRWAASGVVSGQTGKNLFS